MKALAFVRPRAIPCGVRRLLVVRRPEAAEEIAWPTLNLPTKLADALHMGAFITATDAEVLSAVHAAEVAEAESQAVMERLAEERSGLDFELEGDGELQS
jgi:hypothetical protein